MPNPNNRDLPPFQRQETLASFGQPDPIIDLFLRTIGRKGLTLRQFMSTDWTEDALDAMLRSEAREAPRPLMVRFCSAEANLAVLFVGHGTDDLFIYRLDQYESVSRYRPRIALRQAIARLFLEKDT